MNRISSLRFVALFVPALALGCTDAKEKTPASEPAQPASEAPTAAAEPAPEPAAEQAAKPADATADEPLTAGQAAPDFQTVAHDGTDVSMKGLSGKPVVLYFYPKDETPGCTVEAQNFRDASAELQKEGAVVLGVSTDSLESHRKFADNHDLPYPLLADPEGRIAALYGVSTEGGYAERVTFLIDAKGQIARVWPDVQVEGHAAEVLAALQALE